MLNPMRPRYTFFKIAVAILAPFIGWEIGFADPEGGPLTIAGILLLLVSIPLLASAWVDHTKVKATHLRFKG